jgi:hypothetical protein
VFWSVLYIALRRMLEPVLLRSRSNESKELEIVVLRHQLHVLRRQVSRAQPKPADRFFLAAASSFAHRRQEGRLNLRSGVRCTHRTRTGEEIAQDPVRTGDTTSTGRVRSVRF